MTRVEIQNIPTSKSNEPSPFWSKLAKISSATSWHTSAVQSLLTSTLRRTCGHFRSFLLETLQLKWIRWISSFCLTSPSRVQLVFTPSRHVASTRLRSTINPPAWSPLWLSFHHRPAKVKSARSCFMLLSSRSSFTVGKSESLALLSCQFLHPTQVGLSIQRNGRSHQDYRTRELGNISAVSNNKHWCIPSSNHPFVSCTSKALKAAHNTSSWQKHTFPLTSWYSQAWMEQETFHPIQSTSSSQSKDGIVGPTGMDELFQRKGICASTRFFATNTWRCMALRSSLEQQ